MIITIDEKDYEIKYAFNSFKYMQDFSYAEVADLDEHPFAIVGVLSKLLLGGLNYNAKQKVGIGKVEEIVEYIMENLDPAEILAELIGELEKSNFFKQLAKKQPTKRKK